MIILPDYLSKCEHLSGYIASALGFPHSPIHLSLCILLSRSLPLVIELFALGNAHIDFGPSSDQLNPQRHEGLSFLANRLVQMFDLPTMCQELAGTNGVVICITSMRIRRDMTAYKPQFAIINADIGLRDRRLSFADRFDLGAAQDDTRLNLILDEILVKGPSILRHDPVASG